jgi:hypothetical protein
MKFVVSYTPQADNQRITQCNHTCYESFSLLMSCVHKSPLTKQDSIDGWYNACAGNMAARAVYMDKA